MNQYNMEELMPLLARMIRRYTSNESTSIPNHKARQILGSMLYCMNLTDDTDKEEPDGTLLANQMIIKEIYDYGFQKKKEKIEKAKKLFIHIKESFLEIDNEYYRSTILEGMPAFFEHYDLEFDAQNSILTLDYPLVNPVTKLSGIDLIYQYLRSFQVEQAFLSCFNTTTVNQMLAGYHTMYKELVINVCSPVLRCVLVCEIINEDFLQLKLKKESIEGFMKLLLTLSENELSEHLLAALKRVLNILKIDVNLYSNYFAGEVLFFAKELHLYRMDLDALEKVIPTIKHKYYVENEYFKDGAVMTDQLLRNLIEEISICSLLSEKLDLVKARVTSLNDLREVLDTCFWGEEYNAVFDLLTRNEKDYLLSDIDEKVEFKTGLLEWEKALILYKTTRTR